MERGDLRTTQEEADVIVTQQMVHLASQGVQSIQVISDDTACSGEANMASSHGWNQTWKVIN